MKHLNIHDIPPELATALAAERRRRGVSLEATVVEILCQSLGLAAGGERNGELPEVPGSWGEEEGQSLDAAPLCADRVDDLCDLLAATSESGEERMAWCIKRSCAASGTTAEAALEGTSAAASADTAKCRHCSLSKPAHRDLCPPHVGSPRPFRGRSSRPIRLA